MSDLQYEVTDGIATLTMNRPEARNALTIAMYEGLGKACREIAPDGPVKALIITGAGDKAFAAGTDMSEFRGYSKPEDALDYEKKMDGIFTDIERCPVPTIAAINGACTGGGAAIAAACDLRICDNRLKFGFPIARTLGNCLSISNLLRLAAQIGQSRVREILFTARLIEADEAKAAGLVAEVLDSPEDVRTRARELAGTLATFAPLTLRATKEALRRLRVDGPDADDSDLIVGCYMSDDFKEGIESFLSKRKPQWQGR